MTPTAAILAFAAARHRLPGHVRADTERLVADTLAVGCAGATAPGAAAVRTAAGAMGSGRDAPLLGGTAWMPAPAAAMVNGFQIHALEWDAVHEGAVVHAMSVVVAAVHAAAHRAGGVDTDDAMAAIAVGVEIACLLGEAATGGLRFFRPATAGVMGAAIAVARLTGASLLDALGFAHAQAAGTMQAHVEGSVALPVQIGLAARAAVTAADLAAAGLVAPHDVLEGPFGHFALFETGDLAGHVGALGSRWRIAETSVKPWPCGRASHALLSALDGRMPPGRIVAHVPPLVARLVDRPWTPGTAPGMAPGMTPAYARLCLPFLAALMMAEGRIDPRRFARDSFADPGLGALAARLTIVVDDNPDPNALAPQRFEMDDDVVRVPAAAGSPAAPLSPDRQAAKQAFALSLAGDPPFDPLPMLCGACP